MNKRAVIFIVVCGLLIAAGAVYAGFVTWMLFAVGEQFRAFESYMAVVFAVIAVIAVLLFAGVIRMARQMGSIDAKP